MISERFKRLLGKQKTKDELKLHYEEQLELEKGDFPAMIIAALITFVPILLIVLAVFFGGLWLFFGRG